MLTWIVGPFLAVFPARWRDALHLDEVLDWNRATFLSGLIESIASIVLLGYWYMWVMNTFIDRVVDSATEGRYSIEISGQQVNGAALLVLALNPITWLIAFMIVEGVVRLCAGAFTDTPAGIFPLWLLDRLLLRFSTDRPAPQGHLASFLSAIREKAVNLRVSELPDEFRYFFRDPSFFLEIRSWRRKLDWDPLRIIRVDEAFYRIESAEFLSPPRPVYYLLLRLPGGVMSRSVRTYRTSGAIPREEPLRPA